MNYTANSLRGMAITALLVPAVVGAQTLPPVPVPPENPITPEKTILGKILFWEEQLSSNNTIACGTCHQPGAGSTDPRPALHPGLDEIPNTPDDILGSLGVARMDQTQAYVEDDIFGHDVQVTGRSTPSFLGTQWAPETFWDGRAGSQFLDPETGVVQVAVGGALENQAVGPILNDVEMAHENRSWSDVTGKLQGATPLAFASDLPADMLAALTVDPTYPDLFAAAFGDPAITATRIGFAIATYERTLIPDQTPWDDFIAGNQQALTPAQAQGWQVFQGSACANCHQPPLFTDNTFRNIGLRPIAEDAGRQDVTGIPPDAGRFKVPTLRNVGIMPRLMHNGQIEDVADALDFYLLRNGHVHFPQNQDPLVQGGVPLPPPAVPQVIDFLQNGLTDPRVAAETFPFDRPALGSETSVDVTVDLPLAALDLRAAPNPFSDRTTLSFSVERTGPVVARVFDIRGALITQFDQGVASPGSHTWTWDGRTAGGRPVPSGVYFVRIDAGGLSETGRVVRMR